MKLVTRTLVVWLMLLLVPFQGLATAGVLPCAPAMTMDAATPGAAPMAGHDHAAMLAAQRASAHAGHAAGYTAMQDVAAAASPDVAHLADLGDQSGQSGHGAGAGHHCGGVSPCCIGAAPAPAQPFARSGPRLTGKLIPVHAAIPAAAELATPERPPRHTLA